MMIREFDLYDLLLEKIFSLRADKRLDIRIMIALSLKAAFFIVWYLVVVDESKFTWIAIGMNLATWLFYHLFFFLAEFRYLTDGKIQHVARKAAFRSTDQFQNFILLVEFGILMNNYNYNTQFHKIVIVLLAVDSIIFLLQNILTCYINKKNPYKTQNGEVSKLAKNTAKQIVEKIQNYKQIFFSGQFEYISSAQQKIKEIDELELSQKIQVEILNQSSDLKKNKNEDIAFALCYDYDAKIYFETPQYIDQTTNINQTSNKQIFGKGDKEGLSVFYIMFFIGSMTSMSVILIILLPFKGGQVLVIFVILEIIGNFVIVCFGCVACCQCGCCTNLCQKSFSKLILSIVEGFVFGITSVYYGIIFGAILIIVSIIALTIYTGVMWLGMIFSVTEWIYKCFRDCTLCYDEGCQTIAFVFCLGFCMSL